MKSEKGVTMTSVILYIIAMSIIVGTVATITNYYYGNINSITNRTQASKEFTEFNSYFTKEINTKGNTVLTNLLSNTNDVIVFSSGNQFKYVSNSIYFNKILICENVRNCSFVYDDTNNKITVTIQFNGKTYTNEYTLRNDT